MGCALFSSFCRMRSKLPLWISVISVAFVCSDAQLSVGFYESSCPPAEAIVKEEVRDAYFRNPGFAAALVRLHFHDCFVRGCDGSLLIDSTQTNKAEKDAAPNAQVLPVYEVIDNAKARIEDICRGVVSCADIVAFAARDSIEVTGGPSYDVPAGRRDGRVSLASEPARNLPSPAFNLNQLTQAFANKGLTQEEMVTLSGAHTLGRSHCTSFTNRLYSFSTTERQDPSLDPLYAEQLKQQCPQNANANLLVPMDPFTPEVTDVAYYKQVLDNRGLFTSDQALLTSSYTRDQVIENAQDPFLWSSKFAEAMVRMGSIGVLTGAAGEIRENCRIVNV